MKFGTTVSDDGLATDVVGIARVPVSWCFFGTLLGFGVPYFNTFFLKEPL